MEVELTPQFLHCVLDALSDHIVVIDTQGYIVYTNRAWQSFGQQNGGGIENWHGINYLEVCDQSASIGDDFGLRSGKGIRSVIAAEREVFRLEYPCHSPEQQRWFEMSVTRLQHGHQVLCLLNHHNITERKLAEDQVLSLSRKDSLTAVSNRRYLEECIEKEWQRCVRASMPISIALIDIDYFKQVNDTFGHQVGDDYLIKVAQVFDRSANRPGDMCGRYGGEEFLLFWGNTDAQSAAQLVDRLLCDIAALQLPNPQSEVSSVLTVSIGLVTFEGNTISHDELVSLADELLYQAKRQGRNQVVSKVVGNVDQGRLLQI